MKQRNTDIDWIRAILIFLMILIHIVSFGNAYPQRKAGILSFMMPTFLIITGYLVNIETSPKEMGRYLMCLALPYVIMVTGFSVLSYFMPVSSVAVYGGNDGVLFEQQKRGLTLGADVVIGVEVLPGILAARVPAYTVIGLLSLAGTGGDA